MQSHLSLKPEWDILVTDKITPVFFRVIRPFAAALIGLAVVQAMATPSSAPSATSIPSVTIHIPAG